MTNEEYGKEMRHLDCVSKDKILAAIKELEDIADGIWGMSSEARSYHDGVLVGVRVLEDLIDD